MTPRRALWLLILVSAALRLSWAGSLGVGNDEAYHYLFTVHPALSYYDHPPMLAVVEAAGLTLAGGTVSAVSLRLGFILLFAGSTLVIARLTSRFYGHWAGFYAAFVLNVSAYYCAAVGVFALPDGPLLFFWLLTLERLSAAFESPGRTLPWVGAGLAWGGALLSKYHAVFLPAGAFLYILLEPTARRWLRQAGPYVALAVGLVVFSPVIVWNATHGWASFAFQGGRALGEVAFRPATLLGAVFTPALYLFPWIWVFLLVTLSRHLRAQFMGQHAPGDRFLLCQASVPFAVFLAVACVRPVLPHWSLVGFLSLMPMLGHDWARLMVANPSRLRARIAVAALLPIVFGSVVVLQYRSGIFQKNGRSPLGFLAIARDPTAELYGWNAVADELRKRGLVDQPGTFLFTGKWYHSGHLAFALHDAAPVLCYSMNDCHGFAHWSRPEDWVGRDGILLVINRSTTEPEIYKRWFERIEPLGGFEVMRAGGPVRKVRIFRCVRQTRPFPFQMPVNEPSRARVAVHGDIGDNRLH
jgi:4-amino-4-deoxy-L-arabinose transferase-like glycosyltransferase